MQGYLLARPGPAWPTVDSHPAPAEGSVAHHAPPGCHSDDKLADALARSSDSGRACSVVVDHLFRQGQIMPSVYLERRGELRCIAQRGLWQILDGMCGSAGITGRTWMTGAPIVVPDVSDSPDYLEAIPGVVSEICVPITVGDATIGALNVESLVPLPAGMLRRAPAVRRPAGRPAPSHRRHIWRSPPGTGPSTPPSPSRGSPTNPTCPTPVGPVHEGGLADGLGGPGARDAGGHTVAAAAGPVGGGPVRADADRPRRPVLVGRRDPLVLHGHRTPWAGDSWAPAPSATAGPGRWWCCPCGPSGPGWAACVLAHSRPVQLSSEEIRPLEMLADHVAAALVSSRTFGVLPALLTPVDRVDGSSRAGATGSYTPDRCPYPANPIPSNRPSTS